jgi:hypothetical protein
MPPKLLLPALRLLAVSDMEPPPGGGGIENDEEPRDRPIDGRCCCCWPMDMFPMDEVIPPIPEPEPDKELEE